MKTNSIKLTFLTFVATSLITGCNLTTEQKSETLEKAKANLENATLDLEQARIDSAECASYKVESEIKLKENDLLIADMKDKINSEKHESRAKYEKQLDSLNMQNARLRNNMNRYSSAGKENWELFKQGFNKELDALGKAISQLAEKNSKKGS